jgi:hypothetical protein
MTYYIIAKKYVTFKGRKKPTKRQLELIKRFGYTNYRIVKELPKKEKLGKLF